VTPNGDVIVVGEFWSPASFGGAVLQPATYDRAFMTRYRNDGLYLSSQVLGAGAPGWSYAERVVVSPSGSIVVQVLETEKLDAAHPVEAAIHVFDNAMTETWSVNLSEHDHQLAPNGRALAVTSAGVVVSAVAANGPSPEHPDRREMEVIGVNDHGIASASSFGDRGAGAPQSPLLCSAATAPNGTMAFAGMTTGTIDLGMGPLVTHGTNDSDALVLLVEPPSP